VLSWLDAVSSDSKTPNPTPSCQSLGPSRNRTIEPLATLAALKPLLQRKAYRHVREAAPAASLSITIRGSNLISLYASSISSARGLDSRIANQRTVEARDPLVAAVKPHTLWGPWTRLEYAVFQHTPQMVFFNNARHPKALGGFNSMTFGRFLTLLGLIGSFYILCAAIVAKVLAQEAINPQLPSRLESDGEGSNATFSNTFVDPFDFNISADTSVVSIPTAQLWRFLDVFKRQNCQNGENYRFPGSDQSYCKCD